MRRLFVMVASLVVLIAGCGSGGTSSSTSTTAGDAGASTDPLTGSLTVFAAASLTEAFNDTKTALQSAHPGLSITYSFAGSQTLVTQIQNGAPADVIATADQATMQKLVDAALVTAPVTFARNKLEIVVAPNNPKGIAGLADLARGDLNVVIADSSVPAGKYGKQALQTAGVTVHPVSQPLDVKAVLTAVEEGNADAGIVYVTDVTAAGAKVSGVTIPDAQNVVASYPIAVVRASHNSATAQGFVDAITGSAGRRALQARGFLAP